jgi:tRNA threonylcarbamoyladenosine biosynthesis protein TsaB
MIVLWDSADMNVSLTLVAGTVRYDYQWQANRSLARDMLAYLRDRLAEHQATLDDVTGIGVYRGPGSFTGLRIGLTVLNTLAATNRVPIVGALGGGWASECEARLSQGESDQVVLPEYGGEATITKPRK